MWSFYNRCLSMCLVQFIFIYIDYIFNTLSCSQTYIPLLAPSRYLPALINWTLDGAKWWYVDNRIQWQPQASSSNVSVIQHTFLIINWWRPIMMWKVPTFALKIWYIICWVRNMLESRLFTYTFSFLSFFPLEIYVSPSVVSQLYS